MKTRNTSDAGLLAITAKALPIVLLLAAVPFFSVRAQEPAQEKTSDVTGENAQGNKTGSAKQPKSDAVDSPAEQANDSEPQVPAKQEKIQRIPLTEGTVSSNDVFYSVADDVHWIAGEVATVMQSIGVAGSDGAILSAEQVETLVRDFPQVFELSHEDGSPQYLLVNKTQLAARLTDRKSGLRSWISSLTDAPLSKLTLDQENWASAQPPRVVIALSGLHGFSSSADAVALAITQQTGMPVGSFAYPNDEPILQAATRLAQSLDSFSHDHPKTKITLVTHSMGGLVARAVIEMENRQSQFGYMPQTNAIDQIVMVCPPNHGSALSEYGPLLEGVEQVSRLFSGKGNGRRAVLLEMIKDGFNEAPKDLHPKSEFLTQLNACPRATDVDYSILAGNDGPIRGGAATLLGSVWNIVSSKVDEPENLDRRIREVLGADELVRGKGDGVVAVESAKLEMVDDFNVLPMTHLTWSQLDTTPGKQMLSAIVARVHKQELPQAAVSGTSAPSTTH